MLGQAPARAHVDRGGRPRTPGTIGHQVFHELVRWGFHGPVPGEPVGRRGGSVRAWRSVLDVPGELDLAIIAVPADEVLRVAEECAFKRVQGLVVLSSGFADRDEAGDAAEHELVTYARRHGMRLIGPNALGVINTDPAVRMHGTFVPVDPIPGRVGLVAQSGVIGAAIIDAARQLGLGISTFAAVGNKADVSSNDLLRYWQDDPGTDVVMCYLESFGNPSAFSRTARALSLTKPVVAVKVGGASAHGWHEPEGWPPDATAAALIEQTGIIRTDNLTQMLYTASLLAGQPLPRGRRVAVVTNSWGPAWLAVDALRAVGLEPTDPVDLSNEVEPEHFTQALEEVYRADEVDAVLVVYAPALVGHYRRVGAAIRAAAAHAGAITTVACMLGEHRRGLLADDDGCVPEFPFPEEAALALSRVARYAAWRAQPVGELLELDAAEVARARERVAGWLSDLPTPSGAARPRRWLGPLEAQELLAAAGLHPAPQELAHDVDAAVEAARRLGYPVALKASGLERLSKTEAGGVARRARRRRGASSAPPDVRLLGEAMCPTIVQVMVPEGVECRVGVYRHEVLGDVLTLDRAARWPSGWPRRRCRSCRSPMPMPSGWSTPAPWRRCSPSWARRRAPRWSSWSSGWPRWPTPCPRSSPSASTRSSWSTGPPPSPMPGSRWRPTWPTPGRRSAGWPDQTRGSPSTRSARIVRRIWVVPPMIV
ncbi:MAG: acetate--CoA ligase family protein [Acidimicrobiales bacterium]